jgi:hypothetical protein
MDLLLEEEPSPSQRRRRFPRASDVSKFARAFSDTFVERVRYLGGNIFSDRPSDTPSPPPPPHRSEPKSVEIALSWPIVVCHVSARESPNATPDDAERHFSQAMSFITAIFDRLVPREKELAQRRALIAQKVEHVLSQDSIPWAVRAIKLISLDLRDDLCVLEDAFFEEIREQLMRIMNYMTELQKENPLASIALNVSSFDEKVAGFPSTFLPALKLTHQIAHLKSRRASLAVALSPPEPSIRELLDSVFVKCAEIYDAPLTYFPDSGPAEQLFLAALDELPSLFHKRTEHRLGRCIAEPHHVGMILLDQCADLIQLRGLEEGPTQMFLFLLFARLYFSEIFLKSFAQQSMLTFTVSVDFQERVHRLRRVTPIGFGLCEKYLDAKLLGSRLVDFVGDNEYTVAINLFAEMNFILCPIDFCMKAQAGLGKVQEVAAKSAFESDGRRTGQVLAKSDYSLSYDQLFDVALVVWLLSDPIDTLGLVRAYDPYIAGLQLPPTLNWAFAIVKGMCEFVIGLDLNEFVSQARQQMLKEEEMDPLHILSEKPD